MCSIRNQQMKLLVIVALLALPVPALSQTSGLDQPGRSPRPEAPALKSTKAKATVKIKGHGSIEVSRAEIYSVAQPGYGTDSTGTEETVIQVSLDKNRYILVGLPELTGPVTFSGKRETSRHGAVSTVHYYDNGKIFASVDECRIQVTTVTPAPRVKVDWCLLTHTRAGADGALEVGAEEVEISLDLVVGAFPCMLSP